MDKDKKKRGEKKKQKIKGAEAGASAFNVRKGKRHEWVFRTGEKRGGGGRMNGGGQVNERMVE